MDTRKQELKRLKKECKRAKGRYVTLWKSFGILFLVLALIFAPLSMAVKMFDNAIAAFLGGTFWDLKNEDLNAIYFKSDFATTEELAAYSKEVYQQAEAEGAVLLKNENQALPLTAGGKVSCFGGNQLKTALEKAGFAVNEALGSVPDYAEAAIVALEQAEDDLLRDLYNLKNAGRLQKIILLVNTADPLKLAFLKGNPYAIDGVLWAHEIEADTVVALLTGKRNPSGSLADTFCYNAANILSATYGGYDGENIPSYASAYAVYQAGVYVDYKYFETRYEDFVMGTGNAGAYAYADDVAFPFGFGLSYTAFTYSDMAVVYNEENDRFEVTLTVTNAGSVAGKETVQIYAQSPYTDYDKKNGVEKPAVSLVGFGKTKTIEPGASETITVYVDKRDLASYDAYGAKTYIMDAGKYYLTVATDAHNAVNNILAAKGFTPETTESRMDGVGNAALTYCWEQTEFDAKTYSVSNSGTLITNRLSNIDPNLYEGVKETVKWLSRQDWQGTLPTEAIKLQLTELLISHLQGSRYNPADYASVEMPTLGVENGLKLYDMIGLAFDDPKWQTLLDQLTFEEMVRLTGDAFYWHMPAKSVQAPGFVGTQRKENDLPSRNVLAATYNTELLREVGKVIGNHCLAENIVCLYGPDGGDYSEDGFLAGKLCAAEVTGIQEKGVNVAIRLFASDACEEAKSGPAVWLNEQAAREIYLRPLQYAVEQSSSIGVMTDNTRWGADWIGGHKELLTGILRNEWGGKGMAIVGNVLTGYLNAEDGLLAGATSFGAVLPESVGQLSKYKNDPVIVAAIRQACHYNLYTLANSAGMNGIGENTTVRVHETGIVLACRIVAVVSAVVFVFFAVMWHRGKKLWKKTVEYLDYRTMKNTLKEEKRH